MGRVNSFGVKNPDKAIPVLRQLHFLDQLPQVDKLQNLFFVAHPLETLHPFVFGQSICHLEIFPPGQLCNLWSHFNGCNPMQPLVFPEICLLSVPQNDLGAGGEKVSVYCIARNLGTSPRSVSVIPFEPTPSESQSSAIIG
uniref:Uncharacterized protein n=1 Tax=Triticum urartu TaxID=4572 RepID=A0A8R7PYB4_TRIUA